MAQVYDPAIYSTHSKLNGVKNRSGGYDDPWRPPRTSSTVRVLHSTSKIVDTECRYRLATTCYNWMKQNPDRRTPRSPSEPLPRLHTSSSAPSLVRERQPFLPPWATQAQWAQVTTPQVQWWQVP